MARRAEPGHSHRLAPRRLREVTPIAVAVNDFLDAIRVQGYSPYTVAYRSRSLGYLVALAGRARNRASRRGDRAGA